MDFLGLFLGGGRSGTELATSDAKSQRLPRGYYGVAPLPGGPDVGLFEGCRVVGRNEVRDLTWSGVGVEKTALKASKPAQNRVFCLFGRKLVQEMCERVLQRDINSGIICQE